MKSIMATLMFVFIAASAFSQSSMGSLGILGKLEDIIDIYEEKDMEVVRVEADIIRTSKESIRTLDPSYTYSITAIGSDRIKDLDIKIYKKIGASWSLIEKDEDESNVAVVSVKPAAFDDYKVVVSVYKFESDHEVGHYGLVYSHN